jgi:hypothetical protein
MGIIQYYYESLKNNFYFLFPIFFAESIETNIFLSVFHN